MRIIGIILVILSLPAFIAWLKSAPHQRKWAYAAIGVLPFTINAINLDAAFISWATWTGYAKGIIVTLLDTLALAIIATHRHPWRRLPFVGLMTCYILAVALSLAFSDLPMSSGFYLFQMLRILAVFVAVAAIAANPQAIRWLAFGLAAGAIFQAVATIQQWMSGALQAAGTMGHQNLLGLMLHFVTLPLLALLLAGERSKLIMLGVGSALLAIAFGASRGTIGFAGIGIALILVLSLARRVTPHKQKIVGLAVLALAVIGPITLGNLERRFAAHPIDESYDERGAFERAAKLMWADNPMGVGANQYVVVANVGGYSQEAGVAAAYGNRSAKVHNMYLLVAAETGWAGLLTLIALFAVPILRGLKFAFADRRDPRGDIVLGATTALMATAAHGFYEWVFVTYQAQYMFAIALGIIAGMIRYRESEQRAARRLRVNAPAGRRPIARGPAPSAAEKLSSGGSGSPA